MADDRMLREMTCDPKFRKVLVTDAKTRGRSGDGRRRWSLPAPISSGPGMPSRGRSRPGSTTLSAMPQVTLVPLDLTDARRCSELAGEIGGKVDILDQHRRVSSHLRHRRRARHRDRARRDGDQLFRPAAAGAGIRPGDARARRRWRRRARPPGSICCRSTRCRTFRRTAPSRPRRRPRCRSRNALRAEMRPAGIRVVNVFPGPIDDEWNQRVPPPKLAPAALAGAIVEALAAAGSRTSIPAISRRTGSRAGATIRRRSNASSAE